MTVVVTGAAGHLGGNLVRALLAKGHRVRAVDLARDWRPLAGLDVEAVEGDIRDGAFLERAFAGAETVYHTAALISLRTDDFPLVEAVNVGGVRNVVAACRAQGVRRLIHFSSIHAHRQEPLGFPVDEWSPLASTEKGPSYDRSKAAGQLVVQAAVEEGLDAVILNPTGIVGPYDYRPSFFGRVLLALAQGTMPALVASGFDWVDARDVAEAAIRAEELAPRGARYILSGHWVSMRDLARLTEEITGTRPPRFVSPLGLAQLAAAARCALVKGEESVFTPVSLRALRSNRRISHELATRELGYRARPLRETLGDLYQWFAQVGMLNTAPRARSRALVYRRLGGALPVREG